MKYKRYTFQSGYFKGVSVWIHESDTRTRLDQSLTNILMEVLLNDIR